MASTRYDKRKGPHLSNLVSEQLFALQREQLLKEVIWLRNGENLLDFNDAAPQLHQQLQTCNILESCPFPPHPLKFTASNSAFSNKSSQARSKPGQFPFSNVELLSLKKSYSEQPNALVVPAVFDQAISDAQILTRMSALQRDGLVVNMKGLRAENYEQPETFRDVLHSEMTAVANFMMENRRETQANAKKLVKVCFFSLFCGLSVCVSIFIVLFFSFLFSFPLFFLFDCFLFLFRFLFSDFFSFFFFFFSLILTGLGITTFS